MTHKDKILRVLSDTGARVCDDCLARVTGIHPRQAIYQSCSAMANQGIINRNAGHCAFCGKMKKVSWVEGIQPRIIRPGGGYEVSERSALTHDVSSRDEHPWYWEGRVQENLVSHLAASGYRIRSVAHTASKAQGIDIVAVELDGVELWVSVKGFPDSSPNTQARHWFAQAVFDVVLYRSQNPSVRLALGLPGGFPTYEDLASRIGWLRTTLPLRIYWVDESGAVRQE